MKKEIKEREINIKYSGKNKKGERVYRGYIKHLDKKMMVWILWWLMEKKYSYEEMLDMLADAESWL